MNNSFHHKIKLLIVDDTLLIRTFFRLTFSKYPDIEVYEAENGSEGFIKFNELNPDIVFSDIMMPGEVDGLILCHKIKEISNCPVILLSAKGQQSDIDIGISSGADLYKIKPISPNDLISIVDLFIGGIYVKNITD